MSRKASQFVMSHFRFCVFCLFVCFVVLLVYRILLACFCCGRFLCCLFVVLFVCLFVCLTFGLFLFVCRVVLFSVCTVKLITAKNINEKMKTTLEGLTSPRIPQQEPAKILKQKNLGGLRPP